MSNKRAVETLGMSHGAAAGRLRKLVLFRQLKKHDENVCVRCGKTIETPDELSIEHIQPWEGRSAELFWNLDNVAFSHLKCNRPHKYGSGSVARRKIGPPGIVWCTPHKKFEPVEIFHRDASNWNGFQSNCKFSRYDRPLPDGRSADASVLHTD